VVTIGDTDTAHMQPVLLGLQDDQFAEILSGLDDQQLVATSNASDLHEGEVLAPQVNVIAASTAVEGF
jgi:hypothetical protein